MPEEAGPDAEERRLFYVAMTRPRRALHVYVPLRFHDRPRHRDDDHMFGQPSRFLTAAVATCFDHVDRSHREPVLAGSIDAGVQIEMDLDALWS